MRIKPYRIIRTLNKNKLDVEATARELGIHRSTVYRWFKKSVGRRYLDKKTPKLLERGLKRKSTRPHQIEYALTNHEEEAIVNLRRRRGSTAEKIKAQLKIVAHHRTIHRFLHRIGLVRKYGYHRRPRFQDTIHMHAKNTLTTGYLQMDVKVVTPELSGLPWTCYEYAIIDIYSRYKEAVILNQLDQDGAMSALLEIIPKLPFKSVFIQTDNGLEFQLRFHGLCTQMGLKHHHIHKRSPNENAIIERSFRTDEEEFYFRIGKRPEHYDELRDLFAEYLKYYNYERLHLGINLKTPYEVVANVMSD
jgi:transposase InsO family protein